MLLPLITSQYLENTMCIRDIGISCWEHLTSLTLFLHFSILHLPISITSLKSFLSDSYSRNSTEMNRKPLKCQTKFAHLLSTHFPFPLHSLIVSTIYFLFFPSISLRPLLHLCFYMMHLPSLSLQAHFV